MRANVNKEVIEGYLYQHDLKVKTVQNTNSENYGKEFIGGSIDVATDEEGLNIINVRYTYVTPTTKAGAENKTYTALKSIIDSGKSWVEVGKENAIKVKCEPSLALNDFYTQDGQAVSQKVNEGGFVTIVNKLSPDANRNRFETDMVITEVKHVDADEEKGIEEHATVRGCVFNFRNAILPVAFVIRNANGMKYFESLGIDNANPIYTKVWGKINSTSTQIEITEESAFGEASVTTREKKVREWVITGTAKEAYDFGDPEVLTAEELVKAQQDREVYMADIKKRDEEYRASKAATPSASPIASVAAPKKTGFNF